MMIMKHKLVYDWVVQQYVSDIWPLANRGLCIFIYKLL